MYIQEKDEERDLKAPPDYSGHTYQSPPPVQEMPATEQATKEQPTPTKAPEESVPTGVLTGDKKQDFSQKGGKRGGIFENLGVGGLFSRIPFLSSLLPPSRERCEGKSAHSDWWDLALLGLAVLFLLDGNKDHDVLPILLLLLLWD
ncbi:MAG: hypothetical protein E7624_05475 [Ruminococcaceae bacterium]|nr:hypothetical protein [Oscillospiraceae bacterium]